MVSKCKAWLARWFDLKERAKDEHARAKHYAMLYQDTLEDLISASQQLGQLRRRIQELEAPVAVPVTEKKSAPAPLSVVRPSPRSLLAL